MKHFLTLRWKAIHARNVWNDYLLQHIPLWSETHYLTMSITQQQIESDTTKWLTATHIHSHWKSRIIGTYHVSRLPKSLIKIHIVVDFPYVALRDIWQFRWPKAMFKICRIAPHLSLTRFSKRIPILTANNKNVKMILNTFGQLVSSNTPQCVDRIHPRVNWKGSRLHGSISPRQQADRCTLCLSMSDNRFRF